MGWNLFLAGFADLLSLLIVAFLGRPIWCRRQERPARIFLGILISLGIANLLGLAGRIVDLLALTVREPGMLFWQDAIHNLRPISDIAILMTTVFWLHLFLIYPERHPALRRLSWLPLLFYGPAGLLAACQFARLFVGDTGGPVSQWTLILDPALLVFGGLVVVAGFFLFLRSYVQVRQKQDRQVLRDIFIGLSVVLVLVLVFYILPELLGWSALAHMYPLLRPLTLLVVLGVFAFAIARYQLFNVQLVLRQSLAYTTVTIILVAMYVLLARGLARLLGQPILSDNPLLLVLFVLLTTALLNPLHVWLEEAVGRLFYPQHYDYRRVVRQFGQDLSQLQELPVLMRLILDQAISTWRLKTAALVLREDEGDPYLVRAVRGVTEKCQELFFSPDGGVVQALLCRQQAMEIQREGEWLAQLPAGEIAALEDLHGLLLVPMWTHGKLIGWLHLGEKRSERPYTPDDIELFCTLADQAGVALTNALLYERRRREVAALEALNHISLAATTLELDELLEQIYREVARLMDAPNFYIALYDKGARTFSFVFYVKDGRRQWPEEGTTWPLGTGLTSDLVRTRKPISTSDYVIECERRGIQPRERSRGLPGLAWMGVPLMELERVVGVLCISSARETTVYRPEHIRLLSTIAGQAAIVVERAGLRERERQRVAELETLNEIAQAIGSSFHLDELLVLIHRAVQRVLDVPNFYIALYDEDRRQFSFALYIERGKRCQPPVEAWPLGEGLSSEIVRMCRPIITDDYATECDRRCVQPGGRPGKAWLGVPIVVGEEIIGIMVASSFSEETSYVDEDVRLLSTIATQAAGAIQNARLFQESRRRLDELASFFEVGTAVVSSLALQEVMDTVCREAVRLLDATSACLCDWTDDLLESTVIAEYYGPEACPKERVSDLGVTYSGMHSLARILRQRQPYTMQLSDSEVPLPLREHMEKYGGKSILLLPLIARGQILGYIEVWESRYERTFTEVELLLGQNLASQAAIAVENARLYERTDAALARRVEELTVIEEIARELNMPLDFRQVIDVMLDRAMAYTSATAGVVAMLTPDEQGILLLASRGYPEGIFQRYSVHPWSLQDGITGRAVRTNQPALVDNVRQDPDYADVIPSTRSQLAVPIRYAGQPIGGINLESDRYAGFDEEGLRFLQRLADHAAIAIRNARQYEEQVRQTRLLQQKTDQLTALLQVGHAMRAQLDLTEVLQTVAEAVCRSLGYGMALLSLANPDDPLRLHRVAGAGLSPEEIARLKDSTVPREQYVRMMRPEFLLGRAYFLDHRYADFATIWESEIPFHLPDLGERTEGEWHPSDLFFIPIVGSDGNLLGILSVDDPVGRSLPTLEVAESLELFANQAAVAIENARLFQQVTEVRDRLQSILDSTQDGIFLLNEEGVILLVNPPLERWIGLSRDQIVGMTLTDLVLPGPCGNVEMRGAMLQAFRGNMQGLTGDLHTVLHGSFEVSLDVPRTFDWMGLPVLDRHGEWVGRIMVIRDVTEARETERMREDLSSMLVHDLRGPLTAFLGALETLTKKSTGPLSDVQHTLVDIARDGGQQMLSMVNTLLDIRRLEGGKMPLEFASIHLAELVLVVVKHMEILAQESQLTIKVEIPEELPHLWADEDKIARVLENLLHNAIKYSYPGGMVRIQAWREENRVVCAVVDHGVGVPKAEQERIFDKFAQLHRTGAPRGSGLGLAFCRLTVEAHQGQIWVESEEGKGSIFYFALPISV